MILKGRYCVLERIGKGGEGSLYLARDLELGVFWAVKEIPKKKKSEAKLLRLLEHSALPRMVDYLEKEEFCYLVMEYIRGKSLAEWMRQGKVFTMREISEMGMKIAQVLSYLHTLTPPVYYGDLKPENLMMTEKGEIYLVDFGAAVFAYDGRKQCCFGTPGFAAPEQYAGEIHAGSDIYGFGKTMLALLRRTKKTELIKNPMVWWLFFRCSMKNPVLRYPDFLTVEKKLFSVFSGKHRLHHLIGRILPVVALLFILQWNLLFYQKEPFEEIYTKAFAPCYEESFLSGSDQEKRVVLEALGENLKKILRDYRKEEEMHKTLVALALEEELSGETKKAALYYEQMLLMEFQETFAYGEYGCFLLRCGKEKEAGALYQDYEKNVQELEGQKETWLNTRLWESEIKKMGTLSRGEGWFARRYPLKTLGMEAGGFDFFMQTEEPEAWWNAENETGSGEAAEKEGSEERTETVSGEKAETEFSVGMETEMELPTEKDGLWETGGEAEVGETVAEKAEDTGQAATVFSEKRPEAAEKKSAGGTENTEKEERKSGESTENREEENTNEKNGKTKNEIEKNEIEKNEEDVSRDARVPEKVKNGKNEEKGAEYNGEAKSHEDMEERRDAEESESLEHSEKGKNGEDGERSMEEDKEDAGKELQIQKKSFLIGHPGELRISIHSSVPIHILAVRVDGRECFFDHEANALVVKCEGTKGENVSVLYVFEKNKPEPMLSLT